MESSSPEPRQSLFYIYYQEMQNSILLINSSLCKIFKGTIYFILTQSPKVFSTSNLTKL